MNRSVTQKLGLKPGQRAVFIHAPAEVTGLISIPGLDLKSRLAGSFDHIHLFVHHLDELEKQFARIKKHLSAGGRLWVSWPKSGKEGTDLNIKPVIRAGYDHGLAESLCIRIDDTWAALKFTHPKKGKAYHNSYGKLN